MTINAAWHRRHVLGRNATREERLAWHEAHQKYCACRPIPAKLRAPTASAARRPATQATEKGSSLRTLLSGGDRRSLAQSARALGLVQRTEASVSELAALTQDADWLVAMRALDLLEKLAHERPDWVQPHKRLFIGPLADSDKWEIRLQVVRALPLLTWTPRERKRVFEILQRDLEHPQKFVRAWALDSLAMFAQKDRALMTFVMRKLEELEHSGSKALAARARDIRSSLAPFRSTSSRVRRAT